MSEEDKIYLKHILQAILKIEDYTNSISYNTFITTSLIQDGVVRQIEIIGEATKRLSGKIKEDYQSLPWKKIAGMRDKLIHGYFGVDLDAVWKTVKNDIPYLKSEIKKVVEENLK